MLSFGKLIFRHSREFNSIVLQKHGLHMSFGNYAMRLLFVTVRQYTNYFSKRNLNLKIPYDIRTKAISTDETKKLKHTVEPEMEGFDALFPLIVQDLIHNEPGDPKIQDVFDWQKKVLQYNVPHGKKNRGLGVVISYKFLAKDTNLTEDNLKLAGILGWCVEMVQAHFLITDDIMDQSFFRRGEFCWHRVDGVGLIALNDGILVENGMYYLLKKHFSNLPCYLDLIEAFHQMIRYTSFGQCLDMLSVPSGDKPKFEVFTEDRYAAIVKFKTAYYTFVLPVKLALILAGKNDKKHHEAAEKVLLKIGHFFQVQDDYLDCYGNAQITGKNGTDIQDGKCSWLIVTALKMASNEQKNVLLENYGHVDSVAIKKVENVYDELELKKVYEKYEEEMYQELVHLIDKVNTPDLPSDLFLSFIKVLQKRNR